MSKRKEDVSTNNAFAIKSTNGWMLTNDLKYGSLSNAIRFNTVEEAKQFLVSNGLDLKTHKIEQYAHEFNFLNI